MYCTSAGQHRSVTSEQLPGLTFKCCFAEATARSAGSCLAASVSACSLAVDELNGLCCLLLPAAAAAAEDDEGPLSRRSKHAVPPAANRLALPAQASWDSILLLLWHSAHEAALAVHK